MDYQKQTDNEPFHDTCIPLASGGGEMVLHSKPDSWGLLPYGIGFFTFLLNNNNLLFGNWKYNEAQSSGIH